jgi:hypothetical protein
MYAILAAIRSSFKAEPKLLDALAGNGKLEGSGLLKESESRDIEQPSLPLPVALGVSLAHIQHSTWILKLFSNTHLVLY